MIAEYERAQILERSRRGKRHRAHSGEVSVMSGAPYGYRYIRKTDEVPAAYTVLEAEARVVQRVYEMYTVEGLSIGEMTRRINAEGILTRGCKKNCVSGHRIEQTQTLTRRTDDY
jgi:site-specific DNA recombinase